MSCNGCRVLRKGCSETCILRPCLQWIDSPEAQGNATVFVAKFFGRAGLMSFISAVPDKQRPALFQSLLFEACGRTVNPVYGAVGLLWTGNWHICQAAVGTVLRGGTLGPLPELAAGECSSPPFDDASETEVAPSTIHRSRFSNSRSKVSPRRKRVMTPSPPPPATATTVKLQENDLDLGLNPNKMEFRRAGSPSEESVTTTWLESVQMGDQCGERKLLNLFV